MSLKRLPLLLSPLLLAVTSSTPITVPLSSQPWTLSNPSLNISVPATLPSQAHLDLFAAGVIGDPYHDLNDFNLRWVAWSNWTYTSGPIHGLKGSKDNATATSPSTWLRFDGLDTFAEISLCGRRVASTDNQFRQWWFDVTDILRQACADDGDVVLELEFGSAPKIASELAARPGAETWPEGVQQVYELEDRWWIR